VAELLEVAELRKGFSRGSQWCAVLDGASFKVHPAEVIAIFGSRLVGKTTLLRLVAGIEMPDGGKVRLDGEDLTRLSDKRRSNLLGHDVIWLDRDGPALDVEVSRYVGWPLAMQGRGRRDVERRAAQVLEQVGASGCATQRWCEISNWQRVLVGLARAFADRPRLLVIDDLLDALGPRHTQEASDMLRSLLEGAQPGCCVLMSCSDMESALFADRVLSLNAGVLQPLSGQLSDGRGNGGPSDGAEVIPFPLRDETRESRSAGHP
jgi:predicted ABC-type transport system involved in lysophospholipase L1 biosynthesis ATPase subunit